ncbi:MAG: hypothetical protein ABFD60_17105 [Bryobacteraceae bacterium]
MNIGERVASKLHRRDFLQSALAVAAIPPLCCVTPPAPANSIQFQDGKIIVDLTRVPELRRSGTAIAIVDEARKINLILVHAESKRYVTLNRACTHGFAPCAYNQRRHTVQCTSLNHAEYTLDGTLLHGRTHGNLRAYPTKANKSSIEITLEAKA